MRILFVTSAYPSGQEDPRGIFVHRLARALVRLGVEVTVVAPGAPRAPSRESLHGVQVVRVAYWWPESGQRLASGLGGIVPNLRQAPWLLPQIPTLVLALAAGACRLSTRHDLVHAHWLYPGGIAGVVAARRTGAPLVVTSQGGDLNLARRVPVLRWIATRVASAADVCVGVSRDLSDDLVALGIAPERVAFISSAGVDPEELDEASESHGGDSHYAAFQAASGLRVLYVGSLIPRKSVETLLRAHSELAQRGVRLTTALVGAGPEERKLRALAGELGIADIIFAGPRAPDATLRWMDAAQAVVLPSLSEGRPNAVLEAMALGRPVVASDVPGTRELVRDGETGFLFPPGDVIALARRLERLSSEPSLADVMGQRSRATVEDEGLTASGAAQRYLTLYERALTSRIRMPAALSPTE